MIGRLSYENPWVWSDFDRVFFGKENPRYTRREILTIWAEYGNRVLEKNPK
jgi:tRNA-dihydrouridine synthase A